MGSIQKSAGLLGKLSAFGTTTVVLLAATLSNAAVDTVRVNCGGPSYTAVNGKQWAADSGFVGGTVYAPNNPPAITGTDDPSLHQVERYGDGVDFAYNFDMNPGSYRVYLWNATLWDGACGEGTRIFDVTINGTKVLTNYDMSAEVPCLTAHAKHFPVTTSDGKINITFNVGAVQNPKINAIEIVPLAGSSIHGASKAGTARFPVVTASNGGLVVQSLVEGAYTLELKDLQGKHIDAKNGFGAGSQSFSNLRSGVYFLTSVSGNESVTRTISVLR
jgi:hypothetical protein